MPSPSHLDHYKVPDPHPSSHTPRRGMTPGCELRFVIATEDGVRVNDGLRVNDGQSAPRGAFYWGASGGYGLGGRGPALVQALNLRSLECGWSLGQALRPDVYRNALDRLAAKVLVLPRSERWTVAQHRPPTPRRHRLPKRASDLGSWYSGMVL